MQISNVRNIYRIVNTYMNAPKTVKVLQMLAIASVAGLATQAFGAAAEDLLAGTEDTLMATLQGTGKKYLYIGECVVSLLAYIQTKNVMVLLGIIIVAIFFNIMLTMTTKK